MSREGRENTALAVQIAAELVKFLIGIAVDRARTAGMTDWEINRLFDTELEKFRLRDPSRLPDVG